jgi:hypothetical protein
LPLGGGDSLVLAGTVDGRGEVVLLADASAGSSPRVVGRVWVPPPFQLNQDTLRVVSRPSGAGGGLVLAAFDLWSATFLLFRLLQ